MADDSTSAMSVVKRKFTPAEVAARWGIAPAKVLGWIRSGQLRAVNAATTAGAGRRPRWLIDESDLDAFEARRQSSPAAASAGSGSPSSSRRGRPGRAAKAFIE